MINRSHLRAGIPLALLVVALMSAACMPSAPMPSPATDAPPAPTLAQAETDKRGIQVGMDADGNFYRGDPNAPV